MSILPALRKLSVTLPLSLNTDTDWSEEGTGSFVGSHHGLAIYNAGSGISETPVPDRDKFYVDLDNAEDAIFRDTFIGSRICNDLGLSVNFEEGITAAALSWVSNYGTRGRNDELNDIRDVIINAIKYKLLDTTTLSSDGVLYAISGYYVMLEGDKLYVMSGTDRREFK